jgi:shikimate kinase
MKSNIILIGMPGAGKSTLGVLLAKAVNYSFMDTDLIIQNQQGRRLYEIINESGIEEFLRIENAALKAVNAKNTVIATGGSAVFGVEAMEHLKADGIVVYIRLSLEEIKKRVRNIKTRGIAMKKGKTLEDVYRERVPLYEKYADIIVDGEGTGIEECVELIVNSLNM